MDCAVSPYVIYAGLSALVLLSEALGLTSHTKANSIVGLLWNMVRTGPTLELEEQLIHAVLE